MYIKKQTPVCQNIDKTDMQGYNFTSEYFLKK